MMAESNWKRIEQAPKGIGPVLLRVGSGSLDSAFVGYQDDDGRWVTAPGAELKSAPRYWCLIPQFDFDEAA